MSLPLTRMVGELKNRSARACSSDSTSVFVTATSTPAVTRTCETSDNAVRADDSAAAVGRV